MKTWLKVLSILTIVTPAIVACNNKNLTQNPQLSTLKDKIIINDLKAQQTKIDLSTITKLSGLKIIANSSKTYKELINNINDFDEFKSKPLDNDYKIKFYDENQKEITNDKQNLENVSKIIVKIISSLSDENYKNSTNINITNQTIITDNDVQNYFAKTTLPFAAIAPAIATKATTDKQTAVADIIKKLQDLQKTSSSIVKMLLKGLYKEKIDLSKLRPENDIFDQNQKSITANWFKDKATGKIANVLLFYGNTKTGYFYPIKINLT